MEEEQGRLYSTSCCEKSVEALELLLDVEGCDVNVAGALGITPLMTQALSGNVELVKRLLEVRGIDVLEGNDAGRTALDNALAAARLSPWIVSALRKAQMRQWGGGGGGAVDEA